MEKKKYKLSSESICLVDDIIYFVPRECAVLCMWDTGKNDYEIVDYVPKEDGLVDRLFNGICCVDSKLVLTPYNAQEVWIYDLKQRIWNSVSLKGIAYTDTNAKYVGCMGYGNYAYIFGYVCEGVVRVDVNECKPELLRLNGDGSDKYFWGQTVAGIDGKIYIANLEDHRIARLDTHEKEIRYLERYKEDKPLCGIGMDKNNDLIVLPHHGNELRVIHEGSIISDIELPEEYSTDDNIFNGLAVSDSYIVLFSPMGRTFAVDRNNAGRSFHIDGCVRYAMYDDHIGFIISSKGKIEIYDKNMNIIKSVSTELDKEDYTQVIEKTGLAKELLDERDCFGLEELIRFVGRKNTT